MFFRWSRPADVQGGATMNHLLENFDLVATAPEGIAQLRKLILELAVRGMLVPQEPNDEPASALLLNIEREKARLIKKGEIKVGKTLPAISTADIPYDLPDGWEWVRLNQIATILMGQSPESSTYNKNKEGLPFFQGKSDFGQFFPTTRTWCTDPQRVAPAGSVLISVRAPVGPTNISTEISCIGRGLSALVPLGGITPMLLLFFIRAFESEIAKLGFGSTFVAITKTDVECFLFPLPPLAEQARIVARVQELIKVLDHLQERENGTEKARKQTLLAMTQSLPKLPTPEALAHGWGGFSENLERLVRRAEDVKALRSMVLELAVRGKLVPQDPKEEPTTVLLGKMEADKARLAKAGKTRAGKDLLGESEGKLFQLPESWAWVRLGVIASIKGGKRLPKGHFYAPVATQHVYIQVTNMKNGTIMDEHLKYIDEKTFSIIRQYTISKDDLYITIAGTIGQVGLVPEKFHLMNLTENAAKISTFNDGVNRRFLQMALTAEGVSHQFEEKTNQLAQPKLALKRIEECFIPLPPLSEQTRIVSRVQELMEVLDRLEESLRLQEKVASRLGEAVVKVG